MTPSFPVWKLSRDHFHYNCQLWPHQQLSGKCQNAVLLYCTTSPLITVIMGKVKELMREKRYSEDHLNSKAAKHNFVFFIFTFFNVCFVYTTMSISSITLLRCKLVVVQFC